MSEVPQSNTPQSKRRWRRRLLRATSAAGLLLVLAAAAIPLALRSAAVRRAVLDRAAAAVAETSGVTLQASDFDLSWWLAQVELWQVELAAAAGGEPFLRVPRLRVRLRPLSFLTGRWRIEALEVDSPTLDLGAPLPTPLERGDEPGRELVVARIHLGGGAILSDPATLAADSWLESWRVDGIEVRGSHRPEATVLELAAATLAARRRGAEPLTLLLGARLRATADGPLEVAAISARGDGVDLTGSGRLGFGPEAPAELVFRLAADPERLIPGVDGGRLEGEGELDLRRFTGRARLVAEGFPAEIVEPWIGRGTLERMGAAGSRLDLEADVDLVPAAGEAVARVDLRWRRGDAELLAVDADVRGLRLAGGEPDLAAVTGEVHVSGPNLSAGMLEPWAGEDLRARLPLAGTEVELEADLTFKGLRHPATAGRARAVWRSGERPLAEVTARKPELDEAVRLELEGRLLPAEPGRRRLQAVLRAPDWKSLPAARITGGRIAIDVPDLEAAARELRAVAPGLVPTAVMELPLAGAFTLAADVAGSAVSPELEGRADWQGAGGSLLTLTAAGEPLAKRGRARLEVSDLEVAELRDLAGIPALAGRAAATLQVAGGGSDWQARLRLEGVGVRFDPGFPELDKLAVVAESDGAELRLTRLDARAGDRILTGSGEAKLVACRQRGHPVCTGSGRDWILAAADLRLELMDPVAGIDRLELRARLAAGVLELAVPEIDLATSDRGELRATVPLGALAALPAAAFLRDWPIVMADGPPAVSFALPELDAAGLLRGLEVRGVPEVLTASARGELELDLADLTASRGTVELTSLVVSDGENRLEAAQPWRFRLAERRLAAEALPLRVAGRRLDASADFALRPGWRPSDPPEDAVLSLGVKAAGTVEAEVLDPYLGGGGAAGLLRLELETEGPPAGLSGRLRIAGPEVRLVMTAPYFTRLESPQVEVEIEDGALRGRALLRLNQGTVELTGYRERGGAGEVSVDLQGVRYLLDYGLSTVLSGSLRLALPAEGAETSDSGLSPPDRLSGRLVVDRGLLRRDLSLEREVLGRLLAPAEPSAPDPTDPLAAIELDLEVATARGVRIKNNLADVRATWSPLVVRGSLAEPRIDGRIDVDGGGFLYLYGQTARVDRATLELAGFPELPPEIAFDLTTSLEDPAVAREGAGRGRAVAPPPRESGSAEVDREALIAAGVASHYADRLVGRVGESLGGLRVEVAPLLVFGETDPGARLTVSRDLSDQIAVAVSHDLRQEGKRIYLLDLHDLRPAPSLAVQLFTNDERNQGVTLEQTFELGGGRADEVGPRLREIRFEGTAGLDRRRLRAASGLRKGDRLAAGVEFDVEVEIGEYLRRRGSPGAEVRARVEPVDGSASDLVVAVEPGPKVRYEFRGEELPRAARRAIRSRYRADFFQPAALEEMRSETTRALRGLGYPRPEVTVEVVSADAGSSRQASALGVPLDGSPQTDHTVVVVARGGERRPINRVELQGVPADVAERLRAGFAAQADRGELLAGLEGADRRLLGMLRALGYSEPKILSRRLGDGGSLIVELEPGARRRIAAVRVEGAPPGEEERLRGALPVAAGDPLRSTWVARGVVTIEGDLRGRGYADAQVQTLIAVSGSPSGGEVVTYRVEPGPRYRVREVRFDGAEATGWRWAERVAGIEEGAPVDPREIAAARRRLFGTGLFRSVLPATERGDGGRAAVVFEVEEKPRFQIAYGARWESSVGVGAVVDVVDRNAFGRGVSLGLRGFWSADDQSVRAYSAFPRVFGTRATVEVYAEGREFREVEEPGALITRRAEGSLQVSYPLGGGTTTRGYLRYRDSHVFREDASDAFDAYVKSPVLGWQLVRDTRDDKIDASRGFLASVDLTGTDAFLGGDLEFLRLFGRANLFRPAGRWRGRALTWAQSWRLGLAESLDDPVLDFTERFFAGGELSVRGYANDSLGPRGPVGGNAVGGEALLVVNQELRFPGWRGVQGLVFFDAGNVWRTVDDFGDDLFKSAGVGARAPTPIGLVRLEVAFPLDRREGDDDFKIYFGLGSVF